MLVGFNATLAQSLRKGLASQLQLETLEERVVCAADFQSAPVVPVIDAAMQAHLQSVYRLGQTLGERADVFSKVGDSNSFSPYFLAPMGSPDYASANFGDLGSYTSLVNTLAYFRVQGVDSENNNSFSHASVATYGGWTSTNLLTPGLRGVNVGLVGDAVLPPLLAEIQETRPAIALVMIGTCEVGFDETQSYEENLTTITQYLLSQGVIPVLSTIPDIKLSPDPALVTQVEQYNQIIADVAGANNVPLWNLSAALSSLPNQGLGIDQVHLSVGPGSSADFAAADLAYGMNVRNLTALEVLDKLVKVVEQNAAADPAPAPNPSVPAAPFLAGIYQSILQRNLDIDGQATFTQELNQGYSAAEVVQEIWNSPEHRQFEIEGYYQQFLHRSADVAGMQRFEKLFSLGISETDVETMFTTSAEYLQAHPNGVAFVEGLYQDLLQRTAGTSETALWVNQLQSGQSEAAVATEIAHSQEANLDVIDNYYQSYLGRAADPAGQQYALGLLQDQFTGFLPLTEFFLLSSEYLNKI